VPAASAVTPEQRVRARRATVAWMELRAAARAASAAPAALAERAAIAALAAPAAVVVPGRVALVVWVSRASAVLAAVAARVEPAGMRACSATAPLEGMRAQVALVVWVALRARRARTPRPCSAAPAASVATPGPLVLAQRVWQAQLVLRSAARVALRAPVVLAERAVIAASAARAAPERLDRAAPVALVLRAAAALAASVAWAEPDGMRVVSAMAPLVGMRAPVALVAWAELRARRARTPRRWSAVLAG